MIYKYCPFPPREVCCHIKLVYSDNCFNNGKTFHPVRYKYHENALLRYPYSDHDSYRI